MKGLIKGNTRSLGNSSYTLLNLLSSYKRKSQTTTPVLKLYHILILKLFLRSLNQSQFELQVKTYKVTRNLN